MTLFIVTIKMDLNTKPYPHIKKIGICPWHNRRCTDITGAHHSFLTIWEDNTPIEKIVKYYQEQEGIHVTRVEEA